MVRLSNNLIGILNFVTFLLSIPILWAGIWLSRQANTECERFLEKPVIALGVFLMVVSILGLVGACCRVSLLLWIYLLVMFLLILVLFCFTIFVFVVTNKGAGEVVSGKGYKEYRLGDYSNWLQKRVNSTKNWNKIRSCLIDSKVCKSLIDDGSNTPVETRVAASHQTTAVLLTCQSCKAGLLDNLKHDWKRVAVVNVIFLIFLIIVYSIGCCAFRNNREDNSWKRYP
ncbi:tetraspanin7 [Actinidia rufa]|uniref:Tetraspanin7 n=1 Tax=Actinidia rufa TaxID=165716 RepID=A0A7J0DG09_9ERIC|nr:tetraspanin7 [Actinidia rufa]